MMDRNIPKMGGDAVRNGQFSVQHQPPLPYMATMLKWFDGEAEEGAVKLCVSALSLLKGEKRFNTTALCSRMLPMTGCHLCCWSLDVCIHGQEPIDFPAVLRTQATSWHILYLCTKCSCRLLIPVPIPRRRTILHMRPLARHT